MFWSSALCNTRARIFSKGNARPVLHVLVMLSLLFNFHFLLTPIVNKAAPPEQTPMVTHSSNVRTTNDSSMSATIGCPTVVNVTHRWYSERRALTILTVGPPRTASTWQHAAVMALLRAVGIPYRYHWLDGGTKNKDPSVVRANLAQGARPNEVDGEGRVTVVYKAHVYHANRAFLTDADLVLTSYRSLHDQMASVIGVRFVDALPPGNGTQEERLARLSAAEMAAVAKKVTDSAAYMLDFYRQWVPYACSCCVQGRSSAAAQGPRR